MGRGVLPRGVASAEQGPGWDLILERKLLAGELDVKVLERVMKCSVSMHEA